MTHQERLAELKGQLEQLKTSEGWQRWLAARAKFHKYSWRNQFLIATQKPDATLVRGFFQWKSEFNRSVKKGAKAIWILRPELHKVVDNGVQRLDAEGKPVMQLRFRPATVFDVSDTEPIAGKPEIPVHPPGVTDVTGDSLQAVLDRVVAWAEREGIARTSFEDLGGPYGLLDRRHKTIRIQQGRPANEQLATMFHELAHAVRVGMQDRGLEELIAESVAWSMCQRVGLDTGGFSSGYILSWADNAPTALEQATREIDYRCRLIDAALDEETVTADA